VRSGVGCCCGARPDPAFEGTPVPRRRRDCGTLEVHRRQAVTIADGHSEHALDEARLAAAYERGAGGGLASAATLATALLEDRNATHQA
jgi:hypothetical protein